MMNFIVIHYSSLDDEKRCNTSFKKILFMKMCFENRIYIFLE